MHSPLVALTWQTWGRHRKGLLAVVAVVFTLWVLQQLFPDQLHRSTMGIVVLVVPLAFVFGFLVYAFSYAEVLSGAQGRNFPSWMFTLPVRTAVLVLVPMVSGTAAVLLTWWAVALLLLRPAGLEVGLWQPALGLAAVIAWIQAADWSTLNAPAKVVVVGLVMAAVGMGLGAERMQAVAQWAVPALVPLAYLTTVAAVGHARRGGNLAVWSWRLPAALAVGRAVRRPFGSPARAQLWLEWKRNGKLLPLVTGCILLFCACLIPLSGKLSN